jgi:crotonobetainyl-CoA:carnitine CoA-transferase CaiB-like acyl-CoA transferase
MTVELPHPLAGAVRVVASPLKLALTPVQYRRAPPLLGADTDAVLRESGLDDAAIAALRTAGVV